MNPKTLSSDLSRMSARLKRQPSPAVPLRKEDQDVRDILYSKFCAATSGLTRFLHPFPRSTVISPHAPPTCGCLSNAFQSL